MHTIVVDERERERQFENGINEAVRHCAIGKVNRKRPFQIMSNAAIQQPSYYSVILPNFEFLPSFGMPEPREELYVDA